MFQRKVYTFYVKIIIFIFINLRHNLFGDLILKYYYVILAF